MYKLDTPQRIDKSFTITSVVEKQALVQNDIVQEEQYIEVSGYASRMFLDGNYVIDADQENVDTFGFDLKRLRNGTMPLLFNHHQDKPVGKVLEATYDKDGLLVKAKVYKYPNDELTNFIYHSVKNGIITAFSVGMLVKDFDVISQDDTEYLQLCECEVIEISLVAVPSNPEALFRITNMKSVDGSEKTMTLLEKSAVKPENPNACSGFECAIKSLHKEVPLEQKEELMNKNVEADEKVVLGVTPEALEVLEEILAEPEPALTEDTKPVEGDKVTVESQDTKETDTSNDKPSEEPMKELEDPVAESLQNSLETLTKINISELSDDDMEKVYEALSPLIDQIEERVVAQVAAAMKESMTVTAPAV